MEKAFAVSVVKKSCADLKEASVVGCFSSRAHLGIIFARFSALLFHSPLIQGCLLLFIEKSLPGFDFGA